MTLSRRFAVVVLALCLCILAVVAGVAGFFYYTLPDYSGTAAMPGLSAPVKIVRDEHGVPHIFASDRDSMFYAHGWAQAQAQGNLLLLLYGESRGRAAEYWGPSHLALDRWVQLNEVPERAKTWYDAQDPVFRKYMDEFARGINDYAKAHPDIVAKFTKVLYESAAYTNKHHAETAAMMADVSKIPVETVEHMPRTDGATSLNPAQYQPVIDAAAKFKLIPRGFPAREMLASAPGLK